MNRRNSYEYRVSSANTQIYMKSTVPYIQRELRLNRGNWIVILVVILVKYCKYYSLPLQRERVRGLLDVDKV